MFAELGVDVIAVAVSRDDTSVNGLQDTNDLPGSRSTLGMTNEARLSNDWDSVTGSTRNFGEDVVPNVGFVTLFGSSTGSVDPENTEVVWREAPDGKGAAEWSNSWI